jgi:hypothetical protein
MEILNIADLGRIKERNTVAKATNPQDAEITD